MKKIIFNEENRHKSKLNTDKVEYYIDIYISNLKEILENFKN